MNEIQRKPRPSKSLGDVVFEKAGWDKMSSRGKILVWLGLEAAVGIGAIGALYGFWILAGK